MYGSGSLGSALRSLADLVHSPSCAQQKNERPLLHMHICRKQGIMQNKGELSALCSMPLGADCCKCDPSCLWLLKIAKFCALTLFKETSSRLLLPAVRPSVHLRKSLLSLTLSSCFTDRPPSYPENTRIKQSQSVLCSIQQMALGFRGTLLN